MKFIIDDNRSPTPEWIAREFNDYLGLLKEEMPDYSFEVREYLAILGTQEKMKIYTKSRRITEYMIR